MTRIFRNHVFRRFESCSKNSNLSIRANISFLRKPRKFGVFAFLCPKYVVCGCGLCARYDIILSIFDIVSSNKITQKFTHQAFLRLKSPGITQKSHKITRLKGRICEGEMCFSVRGVTQNRIFQSSEPCSSLSRPEK